MFSTFPYTGGVQIQTILGVLLLIVVQVQILISGLDSNQRVHLESARGGQMILRMVAPVRKEVHFQVVFRGRSVMAKV